MAERIDRPVIDVKRTGSEPAIRIAKKDDLSLSADIASGDRLRIESTDTVDIVSSGDINIDAGDAGSVLTLEGRAGIFLDTTSGDSNSGIGFTMPDNASWTVEVGGDVALELDASASAVRVGFYGATPVAQQTGVAVSAAAIHAALVALGLITA